MRQSADGGYRLPAVSARTDCSIKRNPSNELGVTSMAGVFREMHKSIVHRSTAARLVYNWNYR